MALQLRVNDMKEPATTYSSLRSLSKKAQRLLVSRLKPTLEGMTLRNPSSQRSLTSKGHLWDKAQRTFQKRKQKDFKSQRGLRTPRQQGLLNTAGRMHIWTHRDLWQQLHGLHRSKLNGVSALRQRGHRSTSLTQGYLQLIASHKWIIGFLQGSRPA